jgi:hypothetical protein
MNPEERRKMALAAALRKSRRALPYQAVLSVVFLAAIWGGYLWMRFPMWIAWLASVVAVLGAIGDAMNVIHCRRTLRRLRSTVEGV